MMRSNYAASARVLAVALDDGEAFPELRAAWWAVAANNTQSPALIQDALALVGFLAHLLATQTFDPSSNLRPKTRWDMNFPSYRLIASDLCERLSSSG